MKAWRLLLTCCVACAGRGLGGGAKAPPPAVALQIGEQAVAELRRAWLRAQAGMAAAEETVIVTRTPDGRYEAALQPGSNIHEGGRFVLPPGAAAIFHTHPNAVLPEPSRQDRRLADRSGVPVFTLSSQGLFVYDPARGRAWRLMERLDWLQVESWRRLR